MNSNGKFWCVTINGIVWEASSTSTEEGVVMAAMKVVTQKRRESIKSDTEKGPKRVIGITHTRGICLYDPPADKKSKRVYPFTPIESGKRCRAKADFTDPISVLCLSIDKALTVLSDRSSFYFWDWRYMRTTMQVLEAIPVDHQYISVDGPVREIMMGANDFASNIEHLYKS